MNLLAFFIEFLPLAAFFIVFEFAGLMMAAACSAAIGAVLMIYAWRREGRLAAFPLFSVSLSVILTLAAFILGEEDFIKIQPTLFNGLFALVLLGGAMRGQAMMKRFFGAQFSLTEATWMTLSLRWGMFFTVMAISNELAWRNLDTETWVWIKVFVFAPLSLLFMLAQLPITLRGRLPE